MRAAAGFNAHDALGVQRAGHGEQALVFFGVDVVGDDNDVPALAHGFAEHFNQGGFAGADGPPTPTRKGGRRLVRWGMWCRAECGMVMAQHHARSVRESRHQRKVHSALDPTWSSMVRSMMSNRALNMETVNIYDAKRRLSQIVDTAAGGQDVVVARNGKPLVRITRLQAVKPAITLGLLKGTLVVPDDFDLPLAAEVQAGFEGR